MKTQSTTKYHVQYKWNSITSIKSESLTFDDYGIALEFYTKRILDMADHFTLIKGSLDIVIFRETKYAGIEKVKSMYLTSDQNI